jgi:hypothetical protein
MTPRGTLHALARRAQNDAIRILYEDTLVPGREIARLAGVTERNIYALVRRLGCRPRVRLASGGGRRIVPFNAATNDSLDADGVQRAMRKCSEAVAHAECIVADARAAREAGAAMRQAGRDAATEARTLELLARTISELAKWSDPKLSPGGEPKKHRRREWKLGWVSWPRR